MVNRSSKRTEYVPIGGGSPETHPPWTEAEMEQVKMLAAMLSGGLTRLQAIDNKDLFRAAVVELKGVMNEMVKTCYPNITEVVAASTK